MFMKMISMRRMLSLTPILRSSVMQIGRQTSKLGEVFHHLVFSLELACSILHLVLRSRFLFQVVNQKHMQLVQQHVMACCFEDGLNFPSTEMYAQCII